MWKLRWQTWFASHPGGWVPSPPHTWSPLFTREFSYVTLGRPRTQLFFQPQDPPPGEAASTAETVDSTKSPEPGAPCWGVTRPSGHGGPSLRIIEEPLLGSHSQCKLSYRHGGSLFLHNMRSIRIILWMELLMMLMVEKALSWELENLLQPGENHPFGPGVLLCDRGLPLNFPVASALMFYD